MKIRLAVLFGGKSVEHEVSVISGIQAFMALDREKYDAISVYMTKDGEMYTGKETENIASYRDIPALIKASQKVIMVNEGGRFLLTPYPAKRFGGVKPLEFDMALPVVHGTNVEDGALQGYLKTLGIPFAGPDVTAAAVSMDKFVTKAVLKEAGIPLLDAKQYTLAAYENLDLLLDDAESSFGYPMIVKPLNLGSSVGIGVAKNRGELADAFDEAFRYATKVITEHAISKLREINCSVLGDENDAVASECEEPVSSAGILSYEDKYASGGGKKSGSKSGGSKGAGMAGLSRKIPADIPDEMREKIKELAVRAFKALGCNGVSRIDFMIDEENGNLYFNEINPIPGSLSFYLWEPVGVSFSELLDRVVQLALKRQRQEDVISYKFDTNILSSVRLE